MILKANGRSKRQRVKDSDMFFFFFFFFATFFPFFLLVLLDLFSRFDSLHAIYICSGVFGASFACINCSLFEMHVLNKRKMFINECDLIGIWLLWANVYARSLSLSAWLRKDRTLWDKQRESLYTACSLYNVYTQIKLN